jgi:glycosyltransferase involved in cell wall biosynthesis
MLKFDILFLAPSFYPKIGGLEIVADLLAKGLSEFPNVSVSIITYTSCNDEIERKYKIIRNPSSLQLIREVKKCDIFIHHGLSLKGVWPLAFSKAKWAVIHHLPYLQQDKKNSLAQYLKQFMTKFCHNISVSEYVKKTIRNKGIVIHNPYAQEIFLLDAAIDRNKELLFVGRLVSDKGGELLIKALHFLKINKKLSPKLTIAGTGPEEKKLRVLIDEFELHNQVFFIGNCSPSEVAVLMNQHQVLVIPSIWDEPFGIVALEGLACGCLVLSSNSGGLPEALEDYGKLFQKNNVVDLAEKLAEIVTNNEGSRQVLLTEKLMKHKLSVVAEHYLSYIKQIR